MYAPKSKETFMHNDRIDEKDRRTTRSVTNRKNTPISKANICFEEAEVSLSVIGPEHWAAGLPQILVKSRVHMLFCLGSPVLFKFGPLYSRSLASEKAFVIYNPDADLMALLESDESGILIHLNLNLQHLHQLFVPEAHSAPIFNPANTHVKSYEELDINPELLLVLNQVLSKSRQDGVNRLFFQAKILEIFSLLYAEKPQQVDHCPFLKNESTVRKIKTAKGMLIEQYKNPPTIPELARAVQLNEFQLKAGFKEIYGVGPYHFLMAHKLELAKQLLLSGSYQVQEAAYQIGYSNTSHFINAFRKQYGITPKKLILKK